MFSPRMYNYFGLANSISMSCGTFSVTELQIGDQGEVMYFIAKSAKERDQWMEAITNGRVTAILSQ